MKTIKERNWFQFIALIGILFLLSCSVSRIHYLGETYSEKSEVDSYYDEKDIKQEYKTIGLLVSNEIDDYNSRIVQEVQQEMIREAKTRGADAIVFAEFNLVEEEGTCDDVKITAKLIHYIE